MANSTRKKTRRHFPQQPIPRRPRLVPQPVQEDLEEEEEDWEEVEEEDLEDEEEEFADQDQEDLEEEDWEEEEEEEPAPRRRRQVRPFNAYPLPFAMDPAPPAEEKVSDVVDLGTVDKAFRGWKVVFNLSIDLGVQSLLEVVSDKNAKPLERTHAAKQWMKEVIVAWNFTRKTDQGIEQLPQPKDGGIDRFIMEENIFRVLMLGFKKTYTPAKNALRR